MVDEYQDTNKAQLAVIELIASDQHDVCVVGDDDQSIYSWRGAMYEVIEQFEEMFPKTKIIKLEQNYRCSNIILEAANTVIKNNQRRKDKTLWSASKETVPISLAACEDETQEANMIAEKCITLLGSGLKPKDISVLYRANNQAKHIELALREARIPYKTYGGQSFFERKEVKDFVCYLRLVLNHDDHLALWRVINTPHRGIGLKTLEKIDHAMKSEKSSPFTAMRAMGQDIFGIATSAVGSFSAMIAELTAMPLSVPEDFEALGQAIIKLSGLETDIRLKTENQASRDRKLQNLRSLPKWLHSLAQEHLEDGFDRQGFIDSLALDNDRRDNKKDDGDYVSLMTVHASKGLEFPAVFVVGLEEELLPHKNSVDPQAICEERRLFYVALTRAKSRLFLSYCVDRLGGYQNKLSRKPSRFLQEVPESVFVKTDDVLNHGNRVAATESRKQNTLKRLGSLRESLKQQ
jgi:superfamily I DNA/RNA helicase